MQNRLLSLVFGLIGAAGGGAAGYWLFVWIARQGFYGLMIPGAFLGLGCGLLAPARSNLRGVLCGLAALGLGIYTEWAFRPFVADTTFRYFLRHLNELQPITLIMLAVGGLCGYWLGKDASPFWGVRETIRTAAGPATNQE